MEKDDLHLNVLIGIISGLIVLIGSFVGETIPNAGLKMIVTVIFSLIFFIIFVKTFEWQAKNWKRV